MGNYITATCTPHYKEDVEHSWLITDGESLTGIKSVSAWMPLQNNLSLEDVAIVIENFESSQIDHRMLFYTGRLQTMTFRGQPVLREQMNGLFAKDYIRDGEPFTYRIIVITFLKPAAFCPCCMLPHDQAI